MVGALRMVARRPLVQQQLRLDAILGWGLVVARRLLTRRLCSLRIMMLLKLHRKR